MEWEKRSLSVYRRGTTFVRRGSDRFGECPVWLPYVWDRSEPWIYFKWKALSAPRGIAPSGQMGRGKRPSAGASQRGYGADRWDGCKYHPSGTLSARCVLLRSVWRVRYGCLGGDPLYFHPYAGSKREYDLTDAGACDPELQSSIHRGMGTFQWDHDGRRLDRGFTGKSQDLKWSGARAG